MPYVDERIFLRKVVAEKKFLCNMGNMKTYHPDAAAIDRVGFEAIQAHFGVSRQALNYWRRNGVPNRHRKTLAMLCAVSGSPAPELTEGS